MLQKLWEQAKNTTKDERGDINIFALMILLFAVSAFFMGFEYERQQMVFRAVQDNVTQAITSCATGNLYESFGTVREGTSGAYISDGTVYNEVADTSNFIAQMSMFYAAGADGTYLEKKDGRGNIYIQIKDIGVYVKNSNSMADKESNYLVRYN
ncbi:MAG: hypothetical protein RR728_08585, partial [Oscillospiraceae bacterium]